MPIQNFFFYLTNLVWIATCNRVCVRAYGPVRYGAAASSLNSYSLYTGLFQISIYFSSLLHCYCIYISLQGVLFYACVDLHWLQLRVYTMYQYEAPEWYESDPRCLRVAHSKENHRVILVSIMGAQHAGVYERNCTVAIAVASNFVRCARESPSGNNNNILLLFFLDLVLQYL